MSDNDELVTLAATVLATCRTRGWMLATAESCTGGMVASALTAVAGSSDVVERGFVTYSNEAKVEMLGVAPTLIAEHGAVSWQVAEAMARGALKNARAQVSVAITGIAGPGGGSDAKPVGLVFLALAVTGGGTQHIERSYGPLGREAIRQAAATDALHLVLEAAGRA